MTTSLSSLIYWVVWFTSRLRNKSPEIRMWLGVIFELFVWNKWGSLSYPFCCHLPLLPDCPKAVLSVLLAVSAWHHLCQRSGSPQSLCRSVKACVFLPELCVCPCAPSQKGDCPQTALPVLRFCTSSPLCVPRQKDRPKKGGELCKHLLLAAQQVAGHMAGIPKYQGLVKPLQLVRLPCCM